jgi:two-component system KDP operon response regulator KdpE
MARHVALLGESELRLTGTEFRLLEMLARHPGRVVLREDLLGHVGIPAGDGSQRLLRVAMSRLRAKLRDGSPCGVGIGAIAGVGYQLVVRGES